MTEDGTNPLPLEEEHCTAVEVTEEEVQNSVTLITSLSTVVSYSSSLPGPENYAQDMIGWVFLFHPDRVFFFFFALASSLNPAPINPADSSEVHAEEAVIQ